MLRKSNDFVKNIYVSAFILVSLYTQAAFLTSDTRYYTVFISSAVATGFFISFGKKILPSIFFTSVIGTPIIEILVNGTALSHAFLYALPITFINTVTPLIFYNLLKFFKISIPKTTKEGLLFILSLLLTVWLVALLPSLQYYTTNNNSFIYEYSRFVKPMFIGMSIFATSIIMSNSYDSYLGRDNITNYWDILFAVTFAIIAYMIFSGMIEGFNFTRFGPIFIILFIINAFVFNYRMLIFISWLYICIYNVVYFKILDLPYNSVSIESINLYLLILIIITIFTKVLISEITSKNQELQETKDRYEDMLSSTFELFKVRETLAYDDIKYIETNIKDIFSIAMRIFNDIEYGKCVVRGPKNIKVLATKGYDLDLFKSMQINKQNFNWNNFSPTLNKDVNKKFKIALGERYELYKNELPDVKESVSILIKLNEEEMGAISFDILSSNKNNFTKGDIYNIGAFQSMINSFYEMNELSIKNNSLRDDIVLSLIRTLELYDQYTGGHSEDVAFIANQLSKKMNLSSNEQYDIYWAGIVHDIGKIGISSDIINKTSKLTLAEYKKVQDHPIFGYDILAKSEDLKEIAKLVKHHHEWYNGSGYPSKLQGDEIPIGSQILQVADSVSSMATRRSYQKEKTFDEIIDELNMYKGVQFNPEITDYMIELINEGVIKDYFKTHKK
ncbi:Cyclic di-GMP phosphodiesterase response regulator RpfG [Candidatus Izimaplasma bacterium HR1]|jgi:HD-GYP domain-containing protein (c-di-GMP phosphodiesterase class II)|uniref:HD-GYP domain-containing protein n=1 Tax=Candidatus Izimoplasma sp. HR1 TaxID=1541959 RepID=UPI0004F649A7|nr:Cyclic di-GMP phosphodiesterase response regulator RpfG [Candidatus Izimaplasma bacterium HR1]